MKKPTLIRLRDIVLHHLQKQNKNITLGELDSMETDIRIWVKNAIHFLDDMDSTMKIKLLGDESEEEYKKW